MEPTQLPFLLYPACCLNTDMVAGPSWSPRIYPGPWTACMMEATKILEQKDS